MTNENDASATVDLLNSSDPAVLLLAAVRRSVIILGNNETCLVEEYRRKSLEAGDKSIHPGLVKRVQTEVSAERRLVCDSSKLETCWSCVQREFGVSNGCVEWRRKQGLNREVREG